MSTTYVLGTNTIRMDILLNICLPGWWNSFNALWQQLMNGDYYANLVYTMHMNVTIYQLYPPSLIL